MYRKRRIQDYVNLALPILLLALSIHVNQKQLFNHHLVFLAIALGSLQSDQIAAAIIRKKMTTEGIDDGETFKLSTGGNPFVVKVGTPALITSTTVKVLGKFQSS